MLRIWDLVTNGRPALADHAGGEEAYLALSSTSPVTVSTLATEFFRRDLPPGTTCLTRRIPRRGFPELHAHPEPLSHLLLFAENLKPRSPLASTTKTESEKGEP